MINLKADYVAVDTETTGLNPWGDAERWGHYPARPFAFSFYDSEGNEEYHRWKVDPFTRAIISEPKSERRMREIFESSITKVLHNGGFDIRMLEHSGFTVRGTIHDTLVLMHVVTGGSELAYGLKPLCKKYLGISDEDQKVLKESVRSARTKAKKLGWKIANPLTNGRDPIMADYWMGDPKMCEKYAIMDVERTMLLFLHAKKIVEADDDLMDTYQREMKLFWIVKRMEDRGTRCFPEDIVRLRKFYMQYMKDQLVVAEKNGGKGLNFRSHKQMTEIFYGKRKNEIKKWTPAGNAKLDGTILAELAEKDPLARAILEHRGAGFVLSAFLDPYDRFRVQEQDGTWVLHPNFKQCGPITGRFSCTDPNLMQVASSDTVRNRAHVVPRPRETFGPRDGFVWYLPDYSQIEVWIFACLSQDKTMMDVLVSGADYHSAIATKVYGKQADFKEKFSSYRKLAKLIMFCKLYGGGVGKVAFLLANIFTDKGSSELRTLAEEFVQQFDQELPGVARFMKRTVQKVEREGSIKNPYGRMYIVDKGFGYRATNYMIQGTAADVMKICMINVQGMLDRKWKGTHLLLTLHDELVIEVPKKYHSKKLMREIILSMQKGHSEKLGLPKPLPVDMDYVNRRWSDSTALCRLHLNNEKTCLEKECKEKRNHA